MRVLNYNLFIREWPWLAGALVAAVALEYVRWDRDATQAISNLSAPVQGVVMQPVAGAIAIEVVTGTIVIYVVTSAMRMTMRAATRWSLARR